MQGYKIIKYSPEYFQTWNDFIWKAKNATFLFHRDFISYHEDRFEDYSLLIFKEKKLVAILPANKKNDIIYSHQGLSYGGLVYKNDLKFHGILNIFKEILKHLFENNISIFKIKILPYFYSQIPNGELDYLAFLIKAEWLKRESLSVINLQNPIKISRNRLEGNKRGLRHNLEIREDDSLDLFWNKILLPNLKDRHNSKPVHSLEEIKLLKSRFPHFIKQFNVYHKNKIVAGTTLFVTKNVVKTQYISGNSENNQLGSIDFLFVNLLDKFQKKLYFDFGSSNKNNGEQVNKGLQYWKEGFGARTVIQDFYKIETKNYESLENVLV